MRQDNLNMLQDTLDILKQGYYIFENKRIHLKLTREQMEEAEVFLPQDIQTISESKLPYVNVLERCRYSCVNEDSFSLARKKQRELADSMGGMNPSQTATIVRWLRAGWAGALGVHTHDNLGMALRNTLCAMDEGVTWLDATVTGMGRGPGNARTEELVIEVAEVGVQTLTTTWRGSMASIRPMSRRCSLTHVTARKISSQ